MGLFSFGGSKSKSSSSGQSSSFDVSQSGSVSGGGSIGGSEAQSKQRVAFEDVFARLFGGAEGAAAGLDPSMLTESANQLFSGGLSFMEQLAGGADTDFLQNRISGDDGLLQEQIDALGEDVGAFFREQILPGIQTEAVAGGSLGGSRQGIAEAGAAESAGREFQRGATALRSADASQRTQAADILGRNRIAGAQAGIGGLGDLAGISQLGFGAELEPFQRLSAILGGPTVLGDSSSTSFSTAEDFARAFSSSFGSSQATNQSKGKSSAVSFGGGAS
jgi:hypothetical protein